MPTEFWWRKLFRRATCKTEEEVKG